jgi:hypothetical protein
MIKFNINPSLENLCNDAILAATLMSKVWHLRVAHDASAFNGLGQRG